MDHKKHMTKLPAFLFLCALLLPAARIPARAAEMPAEYRDFTGAIPRDVAELLPDGLFSEDMWQIGEAVSSMASPSFFLRVTGRILSGGLGSSARLFGALIVTVAACALLASLRADFIGPGLSQAADFASGAAAALTVIALLYGRVTALSDFFSRIGTVITAMLPLMGVLYAAGGNTAAAAVNNSTLLLWTDLIDLAASSVVLPGICVCLALTAAEILWPPGSAGLRSLCGNVKHAVTYVLGFCAALLAAVLGMQTVLAAASDSMGARAMKYVAGNLIPVVGSTVGETLRTVAAGTRLLRGTVGVAGIVVIALLLLPVIAGLLLDRLAFSLSASAAELLRCPREAALLRECASLCGCAVAAASLCSLLFVIALTVFAATSSAVGGI